MKDWLTPKEAAVKAEVSSTTIQNWCQRYHIGTKVGGRWRVNPFKLDTLLMEGTYEKKDTNHD